MVGAAHVQGMKEEGVRGLTTEATLKMHVEEYIPEMKRELQSALLLWTWSKPINIQIQ